MLFAWFDTMSYAEAWGLAAGTIFLVMIVLPVAGAILMEREPRRSRRR